MECLLGAIYLASDSLDLEDLLSCHELLSHDASDGEHGKSVVRVCVKRCDEMRWSEME